MCRSHLQRRRVCASRALLARSFRGDIYTMSNVLKDSRSRTSTRQKENLTVADNIRYDEVTAKLGYIIERYECPAASKAKSTKHLEQTAFRQGFRGGFVDAGIAAPVEPEPVISDSEEESVAVAPAALEEGSRQASRQGSWKASRQGSWKQAKGSKAKVQWTGVATAYFEAVSIPAPPKPLEEALVPPSSSLSPWVASSLGGKLRSKAAASKAAASKGAAQRAESRATRRTRSNDPVIIHLDGAADALNKVMVELGGEPRDLDMSEAQLEGDLARRTFDPRAQEEPAVFRQVDHFSRK